MWANLSQTLLAFFSVTVKMRQVRQNANWFWVKRLRLPNPIYLIANPKLRVSAYAAHTGSATDSSPQWSYAMPSQAVMAPRPSCLTQKAVTEPRGRLSGSRTYYSHGNISLTKSRYLTRFLDRPFRKSQLIITQRISCPSSCIYAVRAIDFLENQPMC